MSLIGFLFSLQGRINRLSMALGSVVLGIVLIPVLAVSAFGTMSASGALGGSGESALGASFAAVLIPLAAFLWAWFALSVKRLHDIGATGWFAVAVIVATALTPDWELAVGLHPIGCAFTVFLWFWPGEYDANAYGPRPPGGTNFGTLASRAPSAQVRDNDRSAATAFAARAGSLDDDKIDRLIAEAVAKREAETAMPKESTQSVTRIARGNRGIRTARPSFGRRS